MGRTRFSHFIVTRGGVPCWLAHKEGITTKPVLFAGPGAEPTRFVCANAVKPRYNTIYARRLASRAVERTQAFIELLRGSLTCDIPFVAEILNQKGDWKIVPVLCPPKPKSPSKPRLPKPSKSEPSSSSTPASSPPLPT